MRRLGSLLVGAVALIGVPACGGDDDGAPVESAPSTTTTSDSEASEPGEPYIGALAFDWPRDCSVGMTEQVEKDDQTVALEYDLVLRPAGEHTELALEVMRIVSMNGQRIPASVSDEAVAAFQLPTMVFDATGAIVEIGGIDELFEGLAEHDPSVDLDEIPDGLRQQLADAIGTKYWGTWAGVWAQWGDITQVEESIDQPVELAGTTITQPLTVTSAGTIDDGRVMLTAESVLTADAMRQSMRDLMVTLDGPVDEAELAAMDIERVTTMKVVTDPTTLRPTDASVEIVADGVIGGERQHQVETRRWRFAWDAAGC